MFRRLLAYVFGHKEAPKTRRARVAPKGKGVVVKMPEPEAQPARARKRSGPDKAAAPKSQRKPVRKTPTQVIDAVTMLTNRDLEWFANLIVMWGKRKQTDRWTDYEWAIRERFAKMGVTKITKYGFVCRTNGYQITFRFSVKGSRISREWTYEKMRKAA